MANTLGKLTINELSPSLQSLILNKPQIEQYKLNIISNDQTRFDISTINYNNNTDSLFIYYHNLLLYKDINYIFAPDFKSFDVAQIEVVAGEQLLLLVFKNILTIEK